MAPASKTYARSGTSRPLTRARPDNRLIDPSQFGIPEKRKVAHGTKRDKEHLMLDVLMLALAFGLFAAGIGYAYACERL
jgi:hypothetical protein